MAAKELKKSILESYYIEIEFTKEKNYYSMKHHKKKDFLLLVAKLIKTYHMLIKLKYTIKRFWKIRTKNWLTDQK